MNTKLQITQQDKRGIGYNCKGCIKGKQPRPIFLRHLNCQRLWTTFCQQEGWLSVFISNVPLTGLVWHHHQHHHYHHQHHHYRHQHHHYHHHHIIIIINRPKPAYGLWRSQTSWRRRPMSSTSSSRRMESSLELKVRQEAFHIFVPACSSVRKIHFFTFLLFSNSRSVISP